MEGKLPKDLKESLEDEVSALKAAKGVKGVSEDYLRFSEDLAHAQAKARAEIRKNVGSGSPGAKEGEERLLSLEELSIDETVLRELLRDIEESSAGEGREHLRSLAEMANEDSGLLKRLVTAVTLGDDARPLQEIAGKLELPVNALVMVGRMLAAPFFAEARHRRGKLPDVDAREAAKKDDEETVSRPGRCPTCAAPAGLGVLRRDDGARRLMCSLCGEEWLAPRLMCAFCGLREQSKLATLCVSEKDPRWVEVCDGCRRYLKTVDERLLPDDYCLVLRAEDARTLHLDMMAENEGYVRPAL